MTQNNTDVADLFSADDVPREIGFQVIAAVANTYRALRDPFLKTDDAVELLAALAHDPELARVWIEHLRRLDGELFENPGVFQKYKDEMYVALNYRINSLDDVSRSACLNWAFQTWWRWGDVNPEVFLRPFIVGAGTLGHVSGVMGSGKSDFACLLAEMAASRGFTVVTNIAFTSGLPDGIVRATRLSRLLLDMIDARLAGRPVLVVLDEVSQFFSRREAGRSENIQMEKLLRLTRKFRASMLFVEQVQYGLPTVALELLSARYHKTSKVKMHYATRNMERNYNLLVEGVPRTDLSFDTLHLGGFAHDVNLGEMFRDALIEEEQELALRRAILDEVGGGDGNVMPIDHNGLNNISHIKKKRKKAVRRRTNDRDGIGIADTTGGS